MEWRTVNDRAALEARLQAAALEPVQPEIYVHADPKTKYDAWPPC